MKTITIYERTILERTGFRKYPFKEVTQLSIFYDGKEYADCEGCREGCYPVQSIAEAIDFIKNSLYKVN